MCGSPKITVPPAPAPAPPTPEQVKAEKATAELAELNLATVKEQQELAKKQREWWLSATGKTPEEWEAEQALGQSRVANQYLEQVEKALKGELPVSASLQRSLEEEQRDFERLMAERFGENWAETSAGLRGLSEMKAHHADVLESERRGMLQSGERLGYGASPISYVGPLLQLRQAEMPVGLADLWNQQNAYRAIQNQYNMADWQTQGNVAIQNAMLKAQSRAGLMGLAGNIIGGGLGRLFIR